MVVHRPTRLPFVHKGEQAAVPFVRVVGLSILFAYAHFEFVGVAHYTQNVFLCTLVYESVEKSSMQTMQVRVCLL